ncbi:phosphate ABC transporter permease subunit PstC [Methanofollis tationis]|uniref:Phosphate ABC transporter permease subunit PstC n=1 Tax=Methanofollis tationis TaxID=81417 RepID=A0A7K4HLG2_9EURY|nr:phosphate ABC transporter permease subunit PstC [Methanofollis tationis]NVO65887.1 phosphate ABC transporter permease subunit PstC [Methanofollis tationis]
MRRQKDILIRSLWFATASFAVLSVFFIIFFLVRDSIPLFQTVGVLDLITESTWNPTGATPSYGVFSLIVGTLLVTLGAMAIAVPLGLASAVYLSELAPPKVKAAAKPAIELLAGIPSVVYGFFGLIILTDWLRVTFDVPSGESWLAGSILLGIMALPTIISVSEDALNMVPRMFKEGSLALGATHWQTISRVLVPSAISGITAAVILGMGRAIGETMAVIMVCGNAAVIPDPITNVLSPVRTLTGTLGIEMGEVAVGSMHYSALFAVAVVLLAITLIVNLAAVAILKHIRSTHGAEGSGRTPLLPANSGMAVRAGLALMAAVLVFVLFPPITALAVLASLAVLLVAKDRVSPKVSQKIAFSLLWGAIAAVLCVLGIILLYIIVNGLPALTWEFLTQPPRDLGRAGGIFPAIVGTLYLVGGAIAFALPIGIGAAIYLSEYTRGGNRITDIIRTGIDLLNGMPSIVFGLFGFAFLVIFLNFGVSLLAGMITLGLMILPTIIRTTEEALKSVPVSVREGSLALGATKWQTISRVVLPPAVPGILTGTILSIGRAAGETAPILFTAAVFSKRFLPTSVSEPVMALPYHLFVLATNVPGATKNQYGTALVLLILVVAIYAVAIGIRSRYQKNIRW